MILFLLGWLNFQIHNLPPAGNDIASFPKPHFVELAGWISEAPNYQSDQVSFVLNVTKVNQRSATGFVQVSSPTMEIEYGDKIRVKGCLTELDSLANPGLSTYTDYLKSRGIYCQLRAKDGEVAVVAKGAGNSLTRFSLTLVERLTKITRQTMPEYYATLSNSIVFGSQAAQLDGSVKDTYKRAGVVHLLVASGMQISILCNVGMFFIKNLGLPLGPGIIIISLINVLYALMVGWGASVLRALVMSEIMLIAWLFEREGDAYISLALAVLVILLWQPHYLFDIGFQLTFAATWSLFYIAPAISQMIKSRWPNGPKIFPTILSAALGPTLATAPVTLFHFNQFSLIGIITNFLVLPWIDVITILGSAATLVGLICLPLAEVLNSANLIFLFLIDKLVAILAACPLAVIFLPTPSLPLLVAYYLGLIIGVAWLRGSVTINRFTKLVMILGAIALLAWHLALIYNQRQLIITMLDVGQGDAILIETIGGKEILIDGGSKGMGKRVILPYLRRKGIGQLDLVILTHPHDDHLGGLLELFGQIKIAAVMEPGLIYDSAAYKRFRQLIAVNQVRYYLARVGERINFDRETQGLVLAPSASGLVMGEENANNASIVLRLTYYNFRMLFVGDEEKEEETEVLGTFASASLASNVLKVGHHGSTTASTTDFLAAVKPQIGLISCGRHNKFRHPHKSTLERLSEADIYCLRTDQHGAITISSNGTDFNVSAVK